jgi:hypothetical protein
VRARFCDAIFSIEWRPDRWEKFGIESIAAAAAAAADFARKARWECRRVQQAAFVRGDDLAGLLQANDAGNNDVYCR